MAEAGRSLAEGIGFSTGEKIAPENPNLTADPAVAGSVLEQFKLSCSRFCHREVREARRGDPARLLHRGATRNDPLGYGIFKTALTFLQAPFALGFREIALDHDDSNRTSPLFAAVQKQKHFPLIPALEVSRERRIRKDILPSWEEIDFRSAIAERIFSTSRVELYAV